MFLIVGLGNPERDYANTRHNMGFDVINELSNHNQIEVKKTKFEGLYGNGVIAGEKVILLKPQTFMNLSGKSLIQFANFFKIEPDHIIVIYDDMDLPIGTIKIRKKGGPGTHNGMKSVVQMMGREDFPRVRIGIGRPKEDENIIDYVIGYVPEEELEELRKSTKKAAKAIEAIIENGIDTAMNQYNE